MFGLIEIMWDVSADIACFRDDFFVVVTLTLFSLKAFRHFAAIPM